ncbi:hypothetical protein JCM33774_64480 [Actinophytocola sp. KF-1]
MFGKVGRVRESRLCAGRPGCAHKRLHPQKGGRARGGQASREKATCAKERKWVAPEKVGFVG